MYAHRLFLGLGAWRDCDKIQFSLAQYSALCFTWSIRWFPSLVRIKVCIEFYVFLKSLALTLKQNSLTLLLVEVRRRRVEEKRREEKRSDERREQQNDFLDVRSVNGTIFLVRVT